MPTAYYKENGEWKRLVSLNVLGDAGTMEITGATGLPGLERMMQNARFGM